MYLIIFPLDNCTVRTTTSVVCSPCRVTKTKTNQRRRDMRKEREEESIPQFSHTVDHLATHKHAHTRDTPAYSHGTPWDTNILQTWAHREIKSKSSWSKRLEHMCLILWNLELSQLTTGSPGFGWNAVWKSVFHEPFSKLLITVVISVAEPEQVEAKLFETWSRSRNNF